MKLVLEVTSGPLQGKQFEARDGETVSVGRTRKATVPVADNFLSGVHFAVECNAQGCRLKDLASRNGTKLNGELVTGAPLKDGDQIHAGRTDFVVHIEPAPNEPLAGQPQLKTAEPVGAAEPKPSGALKKKKNKAPAPQDEIPPPSQKRVREDVTAVEPPPKIERALPSPPRPTPPRPIEQLPRPRPAEPVPATAFDSYEAATPDGRLFHLLSNQPQTLMALVDAVRDAKLLDLLRDTREEYQSLYRPDQNPKIAPYLVRLPPRSDLLKQMIQRGWGHQWGVYLTCPLSLAELRNYFRTSLMISMPDGMELFSRFYDPGFFRTFLETCSTEDAEKFFGPVTSYLMEGERTEILLQFTRIEKGVEKKGHLLSDLN